MLSLFSAMQQSRLFILARYRYTGRQFYKRGDGFYMCKV